MLEFTIETAGLEKTLRIMAARIGRFPYNMGSEMSDWQTQDMHRKRPATKRNIRAKNVRTTVRPHSKHRMMKARRLRRRLARKGRYVGHLERRSTRPVLRPILVESLAERMSKLLAKRLTWQTK